MPKWKKKKLSRVNKQHLAVVSSLKLWESTRLHVLTTSLIVSVFCWLGSLLVYQSVSWFVQWLVGRLVHCLFSSLVMMSLIGWLVSVLIGVRVGWLDGLMTG